MAQTTLDVSSARNGTILVLEAVNLAARIAWEVIGQAVTKARGYVSMAVKKVGKVKGATGQFARWKIVILVSLIIRANVWNACMGFIEIQIHKFVHVVQIHVHLVQPVTAKAGHATTDAKMVLLVQGVSKSVVLGVHSVVSTIKTYVILAKYGSTVTIASIAAA